MYKPGSHGCETAEKRAATIRRDRTVEAARKSARGHEVEALQAQVQQLNAQVALLLACGGVPAAPAAPEGPESAKGPAQKPDKKVPPKPKE